MSTIFQLKETVLSIRDQQVRVRELSHAKRMEINKLIQDDKFRGPSLWASTCCVDPAFSEEQAADMPAEVVDQIAREGMRLCGIRFDDDKAEGALPKS